jgi:hypothetical protein
MRGMEKRFTSFAEFWPYYVAEHRNPTNRTLHFCGTTLALLCLVGALLTGRGALFGLMPVAGYGFAWVGHFFFEKNRPATFRHPLYSLLGDFVMYARMWAGRMDAEVRAVAGSHG